MKSTGSCWNPHDLNQIRLDMLRSRWISKRSGRILTRSHWISMRYGWIWTRSRQISQRSGHFLTDRTKITDEMLPSTKNNDFFLYNTVGSVSFGISWLDLSTDPPVSGFGGSNLLPTHHWCRVNRFSDWVDWVGWVGRLASWFGHP